MAFLNGKKVLTNVLVKEISNLQSKVVSASTSQQVITADQGYNGLQQVTINAVTSSIDANIQAGNIKKDVTILGVTGTFEGGGGSEDLDKLINGTITTIDSDVTSVRSYACRGLTSLTSASLSNATSIGEYAFQNCTNLSSLSIPSVTSIGQYAFYNCTSITSLNIQNITSIYDYAFYNCTGITGTITMPNLTSLGSNAFNLCSSIQSISANSLVYLTSTNAFSGCSNLTNVSMTSATRLNGSNVFYNCTNLTTITFANSNIQTPSSNFFANCSLLTSVNWNLNNANGLGTYALESSVFYNCSSLQTIDLGNIKQIKASAFQGCSSLQSIYLRYTSVCSLANINAIPQNVGQVVNIYVPSDKVSSYQSATNWSTLYNNGYINFVAIP